VEGGEADVLEEAEGGVGGESGEVESGRGEIDGEDEGTAWRERE